MGFLGDVTDTITLKKEQLMHLFSRITYFLKKKLLFAGLEATGCENKIL